LHGPRILKKRLTIKLNDAIGANLKLMKIAKSDAWRRYFSVYRIRRAVHTRVD
jgi:hypothetical protein